MLSRVYKRALQVPPSHFSSGAPPDFSQLNLYQSSSQQDGIQYNVPQAPAQAQAPHQASQAPVNHRQDNHRDERPIKEFTTLVGMLTLGYLAVDNYLNRIRLEKLNNESTAINLKTLQIQQANFVQARRKHDLQLLQERKENQKTQFKLSIHIALLRKQMIEKGLTPIEIEDALNEFEKSVRIDNSIKNISGQQLWLDSRSELKEFLPDIHDYDKRLK